MTKLSDLRMPALEVLVDIARTIGERRYVSGGDSRDNWRDMCEWADEFQARFESNPEAGETYMLDIEVFAIAKANDAGWFVCEPEIDDRDVAPEPWARNDIQFPRLIAEISATQDGLNFGALADSMDLSIEEVQSLFDRADMEWESIKGNSVSGDVRRQDAQRG